MLTIVKEENQRVAIYLKEKESPMEIFAQDEIVNDLVIERRGNPTAYIDTELFTDGRSTARQGIIDAVYHAISNRIVLNASEAHPMVYHYYTIVMHDINKKLPYTMIAEKAARFYPCPTLRKDQRDFVLASGPSGVGKTWFASDYCQVYHWTWKHRPIYLFSAKEKDNVIDKLTYVRRIPREEMDEFIGGLPDDKVKEPAKKKKKKDEAEEESAEPLKREIKDMSMFENSLYVFDDIEHLDPPELKTRIYDFKAYLTTVGRSYGVDIVLCNHMSMNYNKTREELNECTSVVLYPLDGSSYHVRRYLTEYVRLHPDIVDEIVDDTYRWVWLVKTHPMTCITENKMWIVKKKKKENRK